MCWCKYVFVNSRTELGALNRPPDGHCLPVFMVCLFSHNCWCTVRDSVLGRHPGPENLTIADSLAEWAEWKRGGCQPNYWKNVEPSSGDSCGPYQVAPPGTTSSQVTPGAAAERQLSAEERSALPSWTRGSSKRPGKVDLSNHDTITMVAIDAVRGREEHQFQGSPSDRVIE